MSLTKRRSQSSQTIQTILLEVGIKTNEIPYILDKEQVLIIRDLEKLLKENKPFIGVLAQGLKHLWDNEVRQVLLPTEFTTEDLQTTQQGSLISIFLRVQSLQDVTLDLLQNHLLSISCEDTDDPSELITILNALRGLPFINKPEEFTTALMDLIEVSSEASQREILNYIGEIIPDNQSDKASKQLSRLLEDNDSIAGAIINCLINFNLSEDTRMYIQMHITTRLLTCTRYYKIFPILFEFLVHDSKGENLVSVLVDTRNTLEAIMSSEKSENQCYKVVSFQKICLLTKSRKQLFDGFITMINKIHNCRNHKPVDILILIMLHNVSHGKTRDIEVLIKKRIKHSLLKLPLFERLFKIYFVPQLFNDYFQSMIKIASLLLNDYSEYGAFIFKTLFIHPIANYMQRHDVLQTLMDFIKCGHNINVTILNIIKDVISVPTINEHIMQLMSLLTKLDILELNEVKQVFEILCQLTCRENSQQSGLKDEIHMLTRKLFSSFKRETRHKGIIAAIIMAQNVAYTEDVQDDSLNKTINEIADLPPGPARDAANILQLARKWSSGYQEMLALYYDELSSMIVNSEHLDIFFVAWLNESITGEFQNLFVADDASIEINGVVLSSEYCINKSTEIDEGIYLNIGELAIKERYTENSPIITLSPMFRLLRTLHYKHNKGDLSSIDALLGCGIIMPNVTDLDSLECYMSYNVANCIFHCINWFREVISAFTNQRIPLIRSKVLSRLNELVALEQKLTDIMSYIPEHKLPSSYFYYVKPKQLNTTNKPAKKFKSAPVVHDNTIGSAPGTQKQQPKKKAGKLDVDYKFREMDTDIIVLLKQPIDIQCSASQDINLHIKQFQFILKDVISKLDVLTNEKNVGLSHLKVVNPVNLITDFHRFLPVINKQAKLLNDDIKFILGEVDDRHDAPDLFNDKATNLKMTLNLILELFSFIISWKGFEQEKHANLLHDTLRCLQSRQTESQFAISRLAIDFSTGLAPFISQCLLLSSAVHIIKMMQVLCNHVIEECIEEMKKLIKSSSEKLLKRKWFNLEGKAETGKVAFEHIDVLVKAFLMGNNIKTLCGIIGTLQEEAPNLKSKEDTLLMLGAIDNSNFHILYRGLCTALLERVKNEVASLTNNEHLVLWRTMALSMQGLMTIVKVKKSKTNLNSFLKKSIGILKVFLSHGIPILEIMLRSKPENVLEIFKIFQTSTRFLHHLCCVTKSRKDSSLISLVPQFRLTLETLVYRVKAALVLNNCSEAFWMGNLKNKDLDGQDILSQSDVTENDDEEEEEMPMDDDDDDDIELDTASNQEDTASEVYELEF